MSWKHFEEAAPELAAFGRQRLAAGVAYLATVRPDGGPRAHPVTPILGEGRLFLFMEPDSPKGSDLRRDGRYALHCGVADSAGTGGEFYVWGRAAFVADAQTRALAARSASYQPAERYVLFELGVERAASTVYGGDRPVRRRWAAPARPETGESATTYPVRPIGVVRSALASLEAAPRQGDEGAPEAWLELDERLAPALAGIAAGDDLLVLTWLHRAERDRLQVHPRGDRARPLAGVFATRSPHRPNPVGLHRVTVLAVEGLRLKVAPLEAIDATPIVDLKPVLVPAEER
jgi:tRNA-Thr(GGU) m(6)t(6)A37 methyltransferase TsaA